MENIISIDNNFIFDDINLENPTPLHGGNFFTNIYYSEKELPLYLQLPKCTSKNGIVKSNSNNKNMYIDLLFNYTNIEVSSWFEKLQNTCMELIYKKRDMWFSSDLDYEDIENIFISNLKSYRSAKYICLRANIPVTKLIKKNYCMIYDENERILDIDHIDSTKEIIPLIHIEGIKFSSKNIQIIINLPQIMVINIKNIIKNEFMIKNLKYNSQEPENLKPENQKPENLKPENPEPENPEPENPEPENPESENLKPENPEPENLKPENPEPENLEPENLEPENLKPENPEPENPEPENPEPENPRPEKTNKDLEEITDLELIIDKEDELLDEINLKHPNEIYYDLYKDALEKAQEMKNASLQAFLDAENIKQKYKLNDLDN